MKARPVPGGDGDEARFERELATDATLRSVFNWGSFAVSILTVIVFLMLIMPLERTSPWLILLSLYGIATRMLATVSWKAFLVPRFVLLVDDPDPAQSAAARAVLDRHREAIVGPILKDLLRRWDGEAVAAIGYDEIAALARAHGIEARRSLGRRCLVAWAVVSVLLWATVIATGAGPRG